MKKKIYLFIGMLILFIAFIIIDINSSMKNVNRNIKYLDSLNVSLKGKVINIKKLERGSGLVLINLTESNYQKFDDRNRVQYFLIVKNNKAEIYIPNIEKIEINDILLIKKRNYLIYRENDLIRDFEGGIGLTPKPNLSNHKHLKNIRKANTLD